MALHVVPHDGDFTDCAIVYDMLVLPLPESKRTVPDGDDLGLKMALVVGQSCVGDGMMALV